MKTMVEKVMEMKKRMARILSEKKLFSKDWSLASRVIFAENIWRR